MSLRQAMKAMIRARSTTHLELMRLDAREFPETFEPTRMRTARIWHCKFKSLSRIEDLRELRELAVATYPDDSLESIGKLMSLEYLSILHLPKVVDLWPLAALSKLSTLSLSTLPSWDSSGKVSVVSSLRPLAELPNLRHLELFGVVNPEKSLVDLEVCRTLKSARFSKYPKAEIERYYRATGTLSAWNPQPTMPVP